MKSTKIAYWIVTGLFAIFMIFSSVPDILSTNEAVTFMTHLGYPKYIIPFLGTAKLMGIIVILIPGFPRIKEWAYAGLTFDLIGAMYSIFSGGDKNWGWTFMLVPIALIICSYLLYHKRLNTMTSNP